jgi:hypothetical protein
MPDDDPNPRAPSPPLYGVRSVPTARLRICGKCREFGKETSAQIVDGVSTGLCATHNEYERRLRVELRRMKASQSEVTAKEIAAVKARIIAEMKGST